MPLVEIQELGVSLEFPEGTPDEVIDQAVQEQLGQETGGAVQYAGTLGVDVGKTIVSGFARSHLNTLLGFEEHRNVRAETETPSFHRTPSPHTRFHMKEWSEAQREMGRPLDDQAWKEELIRFQEQRQNEFIGKLKNTIAKVPERPKREDFFGQAVAGAAEFLPEMGITMVNPLAGVVATFSHLFGSSYEEYIEQGVDKDRAFEAAMISATTQLPIEFLGNLTQLGFFTKLVGKFSKFGIKKQVVSRAQDFIKNLIKSSAVEAVEESMQTVPEEIAHTYAANPQMSTEEILDDVWKHKRDLTAKMVRGGAAGFVGSGVLFGAAGTIQAPFSQMAYSRDKKRIDEMLSAVETDTPGVVEDGIKSGFLDPGDVEAVKEVVADVLPPDRATPVIAKIEEHEKLFGVEPEMEEVVEEARIEEVAERVPPKEVPPEAVPAVTPERKKVLEKILEKPEVPPVEKPPVAPPVEKVPVVEKPPVPEVPTEPAVTREQVEKTPSLAAYVIKRPEIHAPEAVEAAKKIHKEPVRKAIKKEAQLELDFYSPKTQKLSMKALPKLKQTKPTKGTTKGTVGNKFIITADGTRYETKGKLHSDILDAFPEVDPNTIVSTGIVGPKKEDTALSLNAIYHLSNNQMANLQATAKAIKSIWAKRGAPKEVLDAIDVQITPWVEIDPELARASLEQWEKRGYDVKDPTMMAIPGAITFLQGGRATVQLSMYHPTFEALTRTSFHELYEFYRGSGYIAKGDLKVLDRHFTTVEEEGDAFAELAVDERALPNLPGPVKRILLRMKRFLQALKNWLKGKGWTRPEDVFGKLLSGGVLPTTMRHDLTARQALALREGVLEGGVERHIFKSPERESQWREAEDVADPGLWERFKGGWNTAVAKATREFEHLPRKGPEATEFAELRASLLKLAKQKGIVTPKALGTIRDITADLNEVDYHNFRDWVILRDLKEEAEYQKEKGDRVRLAGGMTEEEVDLELAEVEKLAAPVVQAAMKKRDAQWKKLRGQYIQAMKNIGINLEERLKRQHYFRHVVLDYVDDAGIYGTGERLKTPVGRPFLKTRTGSQAMIMTNYLKVEHEVMSQLLYDIEIANTIDSVRRNYDELDLFRVEAASRNYRNVISLLNAYAQEMDVPKGQKRPTGEELYKKLGTKMAIGFDRLGQLAAAEQLPLGPNLEYAGLVTELGNNWLINTEIKQEMGKDWTSDDRVPLKAPYDSQLLKLSNYILKERTAGGAAKGAAATIFKGVSERKAAVKEILGPEFATWEKLVRAHPDYTTFQPERGNMFYHVYSIPETLVEDMIAEGMTDLKVKESQIRGVLALGGKKRTLVVKNEVADTLNSLTRPRANAWRFNRKALKAWKQWQLLMPRRAIKYNFRNLTGDMDAVFAGNVRGIKKVKQATIELAHAAMLQSPNYANLSAKNKARFESVFGKPTMTENMNDWIELGGYGTLLQAQEMDEFDSFMRFSEDMIKFSDVKSMKDVTLKGVKSIYRTIRKYTDLREAILRYANYLDYLEQMRADPKGKPANFGASNPEEILGIADTKMRAFWLSNELLGAYDRVGITGQNIREHWFPFWSWKEVNFRRYYQLMRNAYQDRGLMGGVASTALKTVAIRSPYMAFRIGSLMLNVFFLTAMMKLWNTTFDGEDDELPEGSRELPHILLPNLAKLAQGKWTSKDDDGDIQYFSRLGAMGDLLEWISLDTLDSDVEDIIKGRKTLREKMTEMARAPVNIIVQGGTPFLKVGAELLTRQAMFPDVFKRRVIRDRIRHVAASVGLENEYDALVDAFIRPIPSKGTPLWNWLKSTKKAMWYEADPFEAAYFDFLSAKRRFQKEKKVYGEGWWLTPRGKVLYNARAAMRLNDEEAMFYYMEKYFELGGTQKGLKQSLANMDPMSGLREEHREEFLKSLTPEDLDKLVKALVYYQQLRTGVKAQEIWNMLDSKRKSPSPRIPKFESIGKLGEIATITKKQVRGGK